MVGRAQTRTSILRIEERRKERMAVAFLCGGLITVGSWIEPTVIDHNHCWLLAWTGSDMWPSSHYQLETQTGNDSCHHCRFGHIPNQFLVFRAKNRQWRVNIAGSPNFGSEVQFCSNFWFSKQRTGSKGSTLIHSWMARKAACSFVPFSLAFSFFLILSFNPSSLLTYTLEDGRDLWSTHPPNSAHMPWQSFWHVHWVLICTSGDSSLSSSLLELGSCRHLVLAFVLACGGEALDAWYW